MFLLDYFTNEDLLNGLNAIERRGRERVKKRKRIQCADKEKQLRYNQIKHSANHLGTQWFKLKQLSSLYIDCMQWPEATQNARGIN